MSKCVHTKCFFYFLISNSNHAFIVWNKTFSIRLNQSVCLCTKYQSYQPTGSLWRDDHLWRCIFTVDCFSNYEASVRYSLTHHKRVTRSSWNVSVWLIFGKWCRCLSGQFPLTCFSVVNVWFCIPEDKSFQHLVKIFNLFYWHNYIFVVTGWIIFG